MLFTWKRWFAKQKSSVCKPGHIRRRPRALPQVEQLEDRNLLSSTPGTENVVYNFPQTTKTKGGPYGSLVQVGSYLYGVTSAGGTYGHGDLFECPINDPSDTQVLHSFNPAGEVPGYGGAEYFDGAVPHHYSLQVVTLPNGDTELIGATISGGGVYTAGGQTDNDGVIFAYNLSAAPANAYGILHSFGGKTSGGTYDGMQAHSPPIYDPANGMLYGMTALGGENYQSNTGAGVIYELSLTDPNNYHILWSFSLSSGDEPHGYLTLLNGYLYGMARYGGTGTTSGNLQSGYGVIFNWNLSATPGTPSGYTVMHAFTDALTTGGIYTDGRQPDHGGLIDINGTFYGMTTYGGSNATTSKKGDGILFSIPAIPDPLPSEYHILHEFGSSATDGTGPKGSLVQGPNGELYGTTSSGGNTYTSNGGTYTGGTVFEFNPLASNPATTYQQVYLFQGMNKSPSPFDGVNPYDNVTFVNSTNGGTYTLYGMTQDGGTTSGGSYSGNSNGGVIFSVAGPTPGTTAANLTLINGNNESGTVGTILPSVRNFLGSSLVPGLVGSLVVQVTDINGNPVSGVTVHWAAVSGGGSVSAATSVTNASGDAWINATLGTTAGTDFFTATVTGLTGSPVTFTETASPIGTSTNTIYVDSLYSLLLNRTAKPSTGSLYWVNLLNGGTARSTVVQDIEQSPEYLNDVVTALYQHYLNRPPDPGGLAYWVKNLQDGDTIEQVTAGIVSSPEFFQDAGKTNGGYVKALYSDILGRPADTPGYNSWLSALNGGESPAAVAMGFLTSTEYRQDLVAGVGWTPTAPTANPPSSYFQGYYLTYLLRQGDPNGVAAWVKQLTSGVSDQAVLASILGSQEGFDNWS